MNLIKLTVSSGDYFISASTASDLLIHDFKEPFSLNGLIEYKNDDTSVYERLSIFNATSFSLRIASYFEVPGYKQEEN